MIIFYMALETVQEPTERVPLEELYKNYSTFVKKTIIQNFDMKMSDIDDIVSAVFLRVIANRNSFKGLDDLGVKRLLYIYTRSVCLDFLKKAKRHKKVFSAAELTEEISFLGKEKNTDLSDTLVFSDTVKKVFNIINGLDSPTKEVIVLKAYYNYSNAETAKLLGLSATNVGTIYSRATKRIRAEIQKGEKDEKQY